MPVQVFIRSLHDEMDVVAATPARNASLIRDLLRRPARNAKFFSYCVASRARFTGDVDVIVATPARNTSLVRDLLRRPARNAKFFRILSPVARD